VFKHRYQKTLFRGTQKYLAKRKLDSVGFIKPNSEIANAPERLKRIKSELELADLLAHISRANKDEQVHKNAAASATIEKYGPAASVKIEKKRVDVSKLPQICALFIFLL
jgi:hypothetical protein